MENSTNSNSSNSRRIVAAISIVLLGFLYLSLLTQAFTSQHDTYICYTNNKDEYYHSAVCQKLTDNTYKETTVYEACQKYKPCRQCNPCVEQYKTTVTERNYILPAKICIPVGVLVCLLLLVGKIKKNKSYTQNKKNENFQNKEEYKNAKSI